MKLYISVESESLDDLRQAIPAFLSAGWQLPDPPELRTVNSVATEHTTIYGYELYMEVP